MRLPDVELKWPNDVLVRGRKLAGVLPEAKLAGDRALYVVVGIGVNLRQAPEEFPPDLRDRATSVTFEGAKRCRRRAPPARTFTA